MNSSWCRNTPKKTIMATRSEKATTAVCRPSYGRREVSVFVAASLNVSSGCNFAEVSAAALQEVSHSVIYCWWLRVRKNSDMEEGLDVNTAWSSLHTDCWLCLGTHFDGRVALRYIMSKQAAAPLNFRLHNLNVAHIVTPLFFYAKTTGWKHRSAWISVKEGHIPTSLGKTIFSI